MINHWHWYWLPDRTRVLAVRMDSGLWKFKLEDGTPLLWESSKYPGVLVQLVPEPDEPDTYNVAACDLTLDDLTPTEEAPLVGWDME